MQYVNFIPRVQCISHFQLHMKYIKYLIKYLNSSEVDTIVFSYHFFRSEL